MVLPVWPVFHTFPGQSFFSNPYNHVIASTLLTGNGESPLHFVTCVDSRPQDLPVGPVEYQQSQNLRECAQPTRGGWSAFIWSNSPLALPQPRNTKPAKELKDDHRGPKR